MSYLHFVLFYFNLQVILLSVLFFIIFFLFNMKCNVIPRIKLIIPSLLFDNQKFKVGNSKIKVNNFKTKVDNFKF